MSTLKQLLGLDITSPPLFSELRKHPSLKWIHLSDLHFGYKANATYRVDQRIICAKIIDDIKVMVKAVGQPDMIFITGDIAYSGDSFNPPQEYTQANDWIGQLISATGIPKEKLYLVPGNHDIARNQITRSFTSKTIHKELRTDTSALDELLDDQHEMLHIWPKLEAYTNFASQYGAPELTPNEPFWKVSLDTLLGKITITGLNTCLLCANDEDSNTNLALGMRQLEAIQCQTDESLLLVLQHHPPAWLSDGNYLEKMLLGQPHILFSGHIHQQSGFSINPLHGNGNSLLQFSAGAGHGQNENGGKHSYSWGTIGQAGIEYFPRVWVEEEQKFKAARTNYDEMKRDGSVVIKRHQLPKELDAWLAASECDFDGDIEIQYLEGVIGWNHQSNGLWLLKIEDEIKNITEERLNEIVDKLKELSGDSKITLLAISSGSIILILKGSPEGFKRIKKLFSEEKLSSLMGVVILAMDEINGATLQAKVTLGEEQDTRPIPDADLLLGLTEEYSPALIKAISLCKDNPKESLNFTINRGDSDQNEQEFFQETDKLINYFLTGLAIEEENTWVNLSAYESNRMIPDVLSETELGRDLLATDCLLKRFTASLLHPETETGKKYWDAVFKKYGSTENSINTFQKVWIVPKKAVVFEVDSDNASAEFSHVVDGENKVCAFVIDDELDILCEEDYLAINENSNEQAQGEKHEDQNTVKEINAFCNQLFKDLILPVIKKEFNTGKTFAVARQCYSAMILSTWCKINFKDNPKFNRFFDTNKPRQLSSQIQSIENKADSKPLAQETELKFEVDNVIGKLHEEDADLLDYAVKQVGKLESKKNFRDAVRLEEKIVEVLSQKNGETHSDTLFAKRRLGELYRKDSEVISALKIHNEVLNTLIELEGKENFNTLVAMSQLGRTMRAVGDYKKACALHKEVVFIRQETIGDIHPHTLLSMSVLADSFKLAGDMDSSRKWLQNVMSHIDEIEEKNCRHNLLEIVEILDSHEEIHAANNLLAKIVELDSKEFGEDNAQVLNIMRHLAARLKQQGDEENANILWRTIDERLRMGTDNKTIEKYKIENMSINDYFYNQYLQLFRLGVFRHIQTQYDAIEQKIVTKTYFSGAIDLSNIPVAIIQRAD